MRLVTLKMAPMALALSVVLAGVATVEAQPAAAASDAEQVANPVAAFFDAADVDDRAAMQRLVDPGSSAFLRRIEPCYLRRVYAGPPGVIGAWMCTEGPQRSRVILARIAPTPAGQVTVTVEQDRVNDRPAPPRTGSALQ
jgi:hypothetical protein